MENREQFRKWQQPKQTKKQKQKLNKQQLKSAFIVDINAVVIGLGTISYSTQ